MQRTFRDLEIGQTFDWVNPETPGQNSFFKRCRKVSQTQYKALDASDLTYRVGTLSAKVFHVGTVPVHVRRMPS